MHVFIILIYMTKYITKFDNDGMYISPLESSRIKYIIKKNIMSIPNGTFVCKWINRQKTEITVFNCIHGLNMEYTIWSEEKNLCKILGME